ncbi:MAG: cyclic pyranopterin monophosphate synthase MoaC [Acidobacteriia bacterium]|nr:cyclic pyranopterin monophosphate synthase MoaC [Terriglobia bacterium]
MPRKLSHYDRSGRARMVDVSGKPATLRTAKAHGFIKISSKALSAIRHLKNPKGNPLEVARVAGIAAAKRTADLIPLCHPLLLTHVDVECRLVKTGIEVESSVTTKGETGVEMEALTAASVAALTIYDMCKAMDRGMEITEVYLVEKRGGRSGTYRRKSTRTR